MKIILIRHGKTPGNMDKRYVGKTDEDLCQAGIDELKAFYISKKYPAADLVFSSPLKRCVQTSEIIYGQQDLIIVPEFKEMDFGDFEGKNYKELNGNPDYQAWIDSNGTLPFPNGESRSDFEDRCLKGFDVLQKTAKEKKAAAVAAVVHGGTIMAIMSGLGFGSYYDFMIKNGEGYIVDMETKKWCTI